MVRKDVPELTLTIVTLLWLRPELARLMLKHTVSIRVPGVTVRVIAVYSPEDPDPATDVPGVIYVRAPNEPFTDKWNAGSRAARLFDPDALMILGSDDFVSEAYVADACWLIQSGSDYVMPGLFHFHDQATGETIRCEAIGKVGAGRTYSRRVLDVLDFRLWEPGRSENSDKANCDRMAGRWEPARIWTPAFLGVKTHINRFTFDHMRRAFKGVPVDIDTVADQYGWPKKTA